MADGKIPEEFEVGEPVLVCRWRLSARALPAANRHMRALGARTVCGAPLTKQLLGWAKQHIEWTLAEGTAQFPDGVLMLMVDAEGRAAMAAGAYEPLADTSLAALAARATAALAEAASTGVAPETLWVAGAGELVCGLGEGAALSGASSVVADLAAAYGVPVRFDATLVERARAGEGVGAQGAASHLLISDEHGAVCAKGEPSALACRLAADVAKLYA